MEPFLLIGLILIVEVVLIYLYAIYLRRSRKNKLISTPTPEPEPQKILVEPLKAEPVHFASEPEPHSIVVEAPKVEPRYLVENEIKIERIESLDKKEAKEPAIITKDRRSKITDIEGIGPVYKEKLNSVNIFTTSDLLEAGATPVGRKELAEKTGISPKLILEWVNLSDLFRIKGIGEEYSDLLEEAGVDTVVELSGRNAANLHAKIVEVNEAKKIVRRLPTLTMIESWIKDAKNLPRKVEH